MVSTQKYCKQLQLQSDQQYTIAKPANDAKSTVQN